MFALEWLMKMFGMVRGSIRAPGMPLPAGRAYLSVEPVREVKQMTGPATLT